MAPLPTQPSTPKLSDQARHVVIPKGSVTTAWPAVRDKCRELGISFRPWQHGAGQVILAKRADGKYASTIGGTGMSIPRQVGKTFLVGAIVFALCLLRPNMTVIWTAHRVRTAEETFGKMQVFARRRRIAPYVLKVILGSGEEEIRFTNGSRILFGSRARGFGRGFDEVDILIFDEGQILGEAVLDDMIPATNQSREPAGALLLFMGTPPRPEDASEVFTRMRTEALSGEDEDTAWIEFGADVGYVPTPAPAPLRAADWAQVAKANPSFPDDTPRESILRMRKKLGPESFMREGLGIWDVDVAVGAIDLAVWAQRRNDKPKKSKRACLVLAVSPDRKFASIGRASAGAKGRTQVVVLHDAGTAWVVPKLAKIVAKQDIVEVALHPSSQAGALIPELLEAGIEWTPLTPQQIGQGCAAFQSAVLEDTVEHIGQPELDTAVANARTRYIAEAEMWDTRNHAVDISPVVAVSTAAFRWAQQAADYDLLDSIG